MERLDWGRDGDKHRGDTRCREGHWDGDRPLHEGSVDRDSPVPDLCRSSKAAAGVYNKDIEAKIAEIKETCQIQSGRVE